MRTSLVLQRLNTISPAAVVVAGEQLDRTRKLLASLPPLQLLNIVFGHGHAESRPPVISRLRSQFKTKNELLEWVYEDPRIFQDVNFVRLPSLGKRVLVSRLVSLARSRYRWLTPRLLHAFAFRPECFSDKARNEAKWKWPALYRRASISKGRAGRRTLLIPSPPLKRVQRCLLELSLNRAVTELPPNVNGCRPRLDSHEPHYGVFRNAAAHLGQQFVVNLDIANFFLSVTVQHIIPALLALKTPMVLTSPDKDSHEYTRYHWTHDAAVFVARLATHHGRLPQGAPTSPAIANLVFLPIDRKILERIGSDFVYTRYVDDMTVSISEGAARRQCISSANDMLEFVQSAILNALEKSAFTLNARKTRVSSLQSGHRITGLRVGARYVDLPRKTKRRIRSLLYRIQKHGFVATANELIGGEIHSRTTYRVEGGPLGRETEASATGKRYHQLAGRRMSTERLAILMLKRVHNDLRVEVPEEVKPIGGQRIRRRLELHEGRDAWRNVERLLPVLWENGLLVEEDEGHTIIRRRNGTVLCRLRSNRALSFFRLSKREAIACVELWHRLIGLAASLAATDADSCFSPVREVHATLSEVLDRVTIRTESTERPSEPPESGLEQDVPLTFVDEAELQAKKVYENIETFRHQCCGDKTKHPWVRNATVFQRPVQRIDELTKWLHAARHLCVDAIPSLPGAVAEESSANQVFDAIRILDDRFSELRQPTYRIEERLLKTNKIRKRAIGNLEDREAVHVQLMLLGFLRERFEKSNRLRRQMERREQWLGALEPNCWHSNLRTQLSKATEQFVELHGKAVWPGNGSPVFSADANSQLAEQTPALAEILSPRIQWKTVWRRLFDFGNTVVVITTDSLSANSLPEDTDIRDEFNDVAGKSVSTIAVLRHLRNRSAHGTTFSGLEEKDRKRLEQEWLTVQNWAAKSIGRALRRGKRTEPRKSYFEPDDLMLTPYEGTEVKLKLLLRLNDVLTQFKK